VVEHGSIFRLFHSAAEQQVFHQSFLHVQAILASAAARRAA
jgi:hypothetical protein